MWIEHDAPVLAKAPDAEALTHIAIQKDHLCPHRWRQSDKDIPIAKPEVFVRPLGHPGATSWRDICIEVSP
jgi:hypothetical protein